MIVSVSVVIYQEIISLTIPGMVITIQEITMNIMNIMNLTRIIIITIIMIMNTIITITITIMDMRMDMRVMVSLGIRRMQGMVVIVVRIIIGDLHVLWYLPNPKFLK